MSNTQRQNSDPFAPGFEPFYIPPTAPIRNIIGGIPASETTAQPQTANPFGPRFQPFLVPDTAPIRGIAEALTPSKTIGRGTGVTETKKSTGYTRTPEDNKIIEEMRKRQNEAIKGYDTRTNVNGVVQTGTDYKPFDKSDFDGEVSRLRASLGERISQNPMATENDVALVKGTNVAGQFSSTRLPGTTESLFSDTPGEPDSTGFTSALHADVNFAENLDLKYPGIFKSSEQLEFDVPLGTPVEFETQPQSYFKPGVVNSMTDRRLRELDQGLIRSGADYFAKGPDGQTIKVDTDLAKAVMLGVEGAREKLDSSIGGSTVSTTEETAFEVPDEPTFGGKVSPFSEQLYKDTEEINFQDLAKSLEESGYNPLGGYTPKFNYPGLFQ